MRREESSVEERGRRAGWEVLAFVEFEERGEGEIARRDGGDGVGLRWDDKDEDD